MSICAEGEGVMNLQDGGQHLGTVRCDTTRNSELGPVDMLFNSDTKPQEAGLKK